MKALSGLSFLLFIRKRSDFVMPKNKSENEKVRKAKRRANGEGSIVWREDRQSYTVTLMVNGERYYRNGGKTKREANAVLKSMQQEVEAGMQLDRTRFTVAGFIAHWLSIKKPNVRGTTYVSYCTNTNRLLPYIGSSNLDKLTPDKIQQVYGDLQDDLAPNTLYSTHNIFSCVMNDAKKWGYLVFNPLERVEVPRREKKEMRFLTAEEAASLIATAEGHRIWALVVVALATGMRRGELLGVKWNDIDFEARTLTVRRTVLYYAVDSVSKYRIHEPKTASGRRVIHLPEFAVEALKKHRVEQLEVRMQAGASWVGLDLVFCNRVGSYWYPNSLLEDFHQLTEQADLGHLRFHDLRHSAATILLTMGVPVKVVQEILGHSSADVTYRVYAHATKGMHKEAMAEYNERFKTLHQKRGKMEE
jgi:integrase